MVFVNDRDFVTCSSDKCIKLWTTSGEVISLVKLLDQRQYAIYACDFSNNDILVIGSMEGQAFIWNTRDWTLLATLIPPGQAVIRTCKVSHDSNYVIIAGDDDMAHIFDLKSFNYVKGLKSHEATIFLATFSHDSSHVITGDNDGVIHVWNVWSAEKKPCFTVDDAHDLGVSCGDVQPNCDSQYSVMVTGGNDGLLKVWKVFNQGSLKPGTIEAAQTLSGHGGSVMSVKFAKDGKIMGSTSLDRTLRLWNANDFVCLRVLEGHDRYVKCCAFNIHGTLVSTGSNDKSINVWKLSGALHDPSPSAPLVNQGQIANANMIDAQRLLIRNHRISKNDVTDVPPEEFICPITQDVMRNPVLCSDGFVYEKAAIEEWLVSRRKTSPMTNLPMENTTLVLQTEMQQRIKAFFEM